MSVLDFFVKRESEFDVNSLDDPLLQALISDVEIDRKKALSIPIVSSSVDLVCDTFAMIPFKLYKQEKNKKGKRTTKEIDDIRVNIVNDDTGDTLDGFQFKKAICEDYLLGKGGYAFIKKIGNEFKGLYYVEDKWIQINKNADPVYKNFDIMVNEKMFFPYQFLKLLRNTKDGASGIGLTSQISRALKTAFQRLLYEFDLASTGGSRKGFIKSQKHLDERAVKALKESWEKYYSGNANTVILNDGMEFQEASNTSKENEINEKNKTFISEIRDIFHIYDNYDTFIKNGIMPIATAFATALNRDLLLEKEKKEYYFAPDLTELLKGSMIERYKAYEIAIKNGFKTRNEIRYMEDDDAIDGLDTINLGLGDVLLNVESGEIYVPNTNKIVKMGENETITKENETDNLPNNNNDITDNIDNQSEGGEEDER
ncbi:MAG: phage portal protein [Bacilli bacterium]|nr:phage portal protein [Bacilli bacterium]